MPCALLHATASGGKLPGFVPAAVAAAERPALPYSQVGSSTSSTARNRCRARHGRRVAGDFDFVSGARGRLTREQALARRTSRRQPYRGFHLAGCRKICSRRWELAGLDSGLWGRRRLRSGERLAAARALACRTIYGACDSPAG